MRDGLKNIFSGLEQNAGANLIHATLHFLRASKTAGRETEKTELVLKEDERQLLIQFANERNLWISTPDPAYFIAEGAEQKVYLQPDGKHVVKTNDSVFYEFREDYFVSLLVHNFLFPSTAYELLGFHLVGDTLYAVVKQRFIVSTEPTDLMKLRQFLESNGFLHQRNQDFVNSEMGVILEDLHDENVLTSNGVFFFIDTVIYLLK